MKKKKTSAIKKKKTEKPKPARAPKKVLTADEPLPFRVENERGRGPGIVICDHASNRVPRALKDMGLKKATLKKHIGWDIGAEDASLHISKMLDMPAVLAQYSRLVIDLNRAPHHVECIPEESDHIRVPANAGLQKKDREQRLKEIYWPYQNKIGQLADRFAKKKRAPLLISVHSFTPEMDGKKRPWHIGIMWKNEKKIAKQLIRNIRHSHPSLLVGENEPYTLFDDRFPGSTIWRHAEERGLPYVFVEFRQDLIDTKQKAVYWADIFLDALRPVLDNPETFAGRKIKPRRPGK
jgi:predicted N-formylglutamate amidohydrolase